jgi:hypothetical protein
VTVETLPVYLEGVVLDEMGYPVQFNWNLEETDTWTPGVSLDTVLLGATKTRNGDLLGLDGTAQTVVRVDMTTGTSVELGTWEGQIYDMAYSNLFSDETTDRVHMISGSYWMPAKDPANTSDTAAWDLFDYLLETGAYEFVAIAVGDIVTVEDGGQTYEAEEIFLLDDNGNVWKLCAYFDGEFYNSTEPVFYQSNMEAMGWTPTRLDESMLTLNSMVMGDDGNLYLSSYTGSTSDFYRLTLDEENLTCDALLFANSGDEVWPAMLVEVIVKQPDIKLGDVNGDGAVDVEDAMLILQLDAYLIDESDLNMDAADVNGDGVVDVEDAMLVLQFDAYLIDKFPAEN